MVSDEIVDQAAEVLQRHIPVIGGLSFHREVAQALRDAGLLTDRNEVLSEVGRTLQRFAVTLFDEHGPHSPRGAAFWDAAVYVVEQMGDGFWRRDADTATSGPETGRTAPNGTPVDADTREGLSDAERGGE